MVDGERAQAPPRATRPALSRERIAAAGVEIADAGGLDAVSMRKVASHLGSGTMSLYRYVETRDDLIDLMADLLARELTPPPRTAHWRADLAESAQAARAFGLRHPWVVRQALSPDNAGPKTLASTEAHLALLDGYGLQPAQMLDIWRTVLAFVQGHVLAETVVRHAKSADEALSDTSRAGTDPEQHPHLHRALHDTEVPADPDEVFERRLQYVLDGVGQTFFPDALPRADAEGRRRTPTARR